MEEQHTSDADARPPQLVDPRGSPQGPWQTLKKILVPIGVALLVGIKLLAKLKFLVLPIIKFFPLLLKTGGTMVLSIWVYAMYWGWMFAAGFVVLMLIHESGHALAAKRAGLRVGAPVFIPFMGAVIALKDMPRNAWIEAQVGLGGPLLGGLGALLCWAIYDATGQGLFGALAYSGFFLNLFNLIPIGFLDGGRIVTALSPWLWVVGLLIVVAMLVLTPHPNFLLFLIVLLSLPRLWSLFRDRKTEYFDVTPAQRWIVAIIYFGLLAFMVAGMKMSDLRHPREPIEDPLSEFSMHGVAMRPTTS